MNTTLVLDASVLRAVRPGELRALREQFDFLLPDALLHELYTSQLSERPDSSEAALSRLDGRICESVKKLVAETKGWLVDHIESLKWEAENGRSARHGPTFQVTQIIEPQDILTEQVFRASLELDEEYSFLSRIRHVAADNEQYEQLRRLNEGQAMLKLRRDFSSNACEKRLKEGAIQILLKVASDHLLKCFPNLQPDRDWLSFGYMLAMQAYVPFKLYYHGDEPADRKKPANPYYDTEYVAHMSLADGILAADKKMLKLAWICWPEKEENIRFYDMENHEVVPYVPPWAC